MLKLIIKHPGNNAYTTIAIESIKFDSCVAFYWRKINESKTRFLVSIHNGVANTSNQWLADEVCRLADGEFVGWCE